MEEQRVSDERLQELVKLYATRSEFVWKFASMEDEEDIGEVLRELQTSRAALSEAEGLVREAVKILNGTAYAVYTESDGDWVEPPTERVKRLFLARPSVAAILARGEKR